MRDDIEYVKEWSKKTGRSEIDIYVPKDIREEKVRYDDRGTLGSYGTHPSHDDYLAHSEPIWVMGDQEEDFDWNAHNGDNLPWWEDEHIVDEMRKTSDSGAPAAYADVSDKTLKQLENRVLLSIVTYGVLMYIVGFLIGKFL